ENCMERAVALGDRRRIDMGDLPPSLISGSQAMDSVADSPSSSLSSTDLEDIERATIQRVFEQVKGDKALAGRMLGISRATLYRKLKRYNIGTGIAATSRALQIVLAIVNMCLSSN